VIEPKQEFGKSGSRMGNVGLIGVGSGGVNAVTRMISGWQDGPRSMVVDTDEQVLSVSSVERSLQVGASVAGGHGTGGDLQVGRSAGENDTDQLAVLMRGLDVIFLVTTLGGGTGSGVAPILAATAHKQETVVIGFATLPFQFEGPERREAARLALRELRLHSDVVLVLPNDRLLESTVAKWMPMEATFAASDATIGVMVRSMWKLLSRPGLLNLNISDIRRMVEKSAGTCSFGYGAGHGESKATQAVRDLMQSPLLEQGIQLAKSSSVLVNIIGGNALTLQDIQKVMDGIREIVPSDAHLVVGAACDSTMGDSLAVTVLTAEQWIDDHLLEPIRGAPDSDDGRTDPRAGLQGPPRIRSKEEEKRRMLQQKLSPESTTQERFKGAQPSRYRGEDMDIPTFIRRGVKLAGEIKSQ
jgi:cell division protein FtsZ